VLAASPLLAPRAARDPWGAALRSKGRERGGGERDRDDLRGEFFRVESLGKMKEI